MSERNNTWECPTCAENGIKSKSVRQIELPNLDKTAAAAWNGQGFNPALGCYTRNDQHAKRIAKSRGYEEVGNENPDKMYDHFEKQRAETAQKRYENVDRVKLYED